ncbi:MAG: large conductance mechanosensitive channel [Candidatus Aldehydirespiratoraceae bacterium]
MLQEFKDFINKGSIVELAVAVVMAMAFAPVILAFVDGILLQFVAMIFGEPNFSNLTFTMGDTPYFYGGVLTAIINFIFVALAVFMVLKAYNAAKADEEEADSGPSEVDLLTEIRDSLAKG